MKIIPGYLLIGSYATLFWLWRQKRKQILSLVTSTPTGTGEAAVNPLAGQAALGYENGDETHRACAAVADVVCPDFRVWPN
jgi:hypothetical protein